MRCSGPGRVRRFEGWGRRAAGPLSSGVRPREGAPVGESEAVRRFHPTRGNLPLVFACGLPFALVAASAPWSAGPGHAGWWLGLVMAASAATCCVIGPAVVLTSVVTVSPAGVSKAPRWNWGFVAGWPRVEWWAVGSPPAWHEAPAGTRVVRLRVAGWRREAVVFDHEVEHPGFEAFVAALREVAGEREASGPNQALQRTRPQGAVPG